MRVLEYRINFSKPSTFHFFPIPDLHFGSNGFSDPAYQKLKNKMHSFDAKSVLTLGLGDYVDEERPSTRRMKRATFCDADRKESLDKMFEANMTYVDRFFLSGYKNIFNHGQCLGLLNGDHYYENSEGYTSTQYICDKLKVPYIGPDKYALIKLVFEYTGNGNSRAVSEFVLFAEHGQGGSKWNSNDMAKAEKETSHFFIADLYLRAHSHRKHYCENVRCSVNRAKDLGINMDLARIVNVPSCLQGFRENVMQYPEVEGLKPLPTGFVRIDFNVHKSNAGVIVDVETIM